MWTIGTRVQAISYSTGLGFGPIGTITDETEPGYYRVQTEDGLETILAGPLLTNDFNLDADL